MPRGEPVAGDAVDRNGADAGPGVKKPDPEQKPPNVEGAKKDAAQNAANKVEAKAATKTEVKPPNAAGKAKPVEKIEPKKID